MRLSGRSRATFGALFQAAGFTGLAIIATGSVLVLAAKVQYPGIGSGASPIEALSAAALAGLGSLGVPIRIGGVTATALPLGALSFVGCCAVWAVSAKMSGSPADAAGRVRTGVGMGLWLGLLSFVSALVFRIGGDTPVTADVWWSLLLGALWGALFGALGALGSTDSLEVYWARLYALVEATTEDRAWGLRLATVFLGSLAFLGTAVVLGGVILRLLTGEARGFGVGDVLAGIIYLILFGPNILIAVIALASGSVLSVGAEITQGGRQVGSAEDLSLFSWGAGGAPGWAFLLPLLPLVATFSVGYRSRVIISRRAEVLTTLRWAAAFVGLAVFFWSSLAEARLGAGLVGERGFARLAPNPPLTALLAGGWTILGGTLGWWVADRRRGRRI